MASPLTTQPPTSLERIRVFHAVVVAGTIAGAARVLGYTPSAVSQQVSTLEREAGVALVERSNRGLRPTAAGRLLAAKASEVLDLVELAFGSIRSTPQGTETVLTVAAFPTAITAMLLPLRAQLPSAVHLALVHAEPVDALDAVRSRTVDCAITDDYLRQPRQSVGEDGLDRVHLRTERVCLVHRADHPRSTNLAAYAQARWVLGGPQSRLGSIIRQACRSAGFTPDVVVESDDHHITFDVIRNWGAVSLLPEMALPEVPDDIVVVPNLDHRVERGIELVTRRSMGSSPTVQILTALLIDQARTR